MSNEQIPTNTTYYAANTFAKQHRIDQPLNITAGMEHHARTIVHHRAPDLYSMIFGGAK